MLQQYAILIVMTVQRCLKCKGFTSKSASFSHFHSHQNRLATGNRELKASHIHCGFMYFRSVETEPCRLRVLFLELKADPCQSQRMHIEEARFVGEGRPQKTISVSMRCQRSCFMTIYYKLFNSRNMVYHHITLYQSHNTSLSSAFTISAKMWHGLLAQTRHPCQELQAVWECSKEIISSFHHFVVRSAHRNTWIGNQSRGRGCVLPHNLTASELAERGRGGAVETQKGLKILLRLSKA